MSRRKGESYLGGHTVISLSPKTQDTILWEATKEHKQRVRGEQVILDVKTNLEIERKDRIFSKIDFVSDRSGNLRAHRIWYRCQNCKTMEVQKFWTQKEAIEASEIIKQCTCGGRIRFMVGLGIKPTKIKLPK